MSRSATLDKQIIEKKLPLLRMKHRTTLRNLYKALPKHHTISSMRDDVLNVEEGYFDEIKKDLMGWNLITLVKRVTHPTLGLVDAVEDDLFLKLTGIGEVLAKELVEKE